MDAGNGGLAETDLRYGLPGDVYVAGRWTSDLSGSHPGVFRFNPSRGLNEFLLDLDGDPSHEKSIFFGLPGATPIVGDWDGNGTTNVGVVQVRNGQNEFLLDTDEDEFAELSFFFGTAGQNQVVADIDGDGLPNAGAVYVGADNLLYWDFDLNGLPGADLTIQFGLPGDIPVPGDYDGDGVDDLAVVRHEGQFQRWYFDLDRNSTTDNSYIFGLAGDAPVSGDWQFPEIRADRISGGEVFSGSEVDFGVIQPGVNQVGTIRFRNTGTQPLNLGSQSFSNSSFEIVDALPATIPAGDFHELRVRFVEQTAGPATSQFQVTANDFNENPFVIDFSATRAAPELEVQVQGVTIANQQTVDFGPGAVDNLAPEKRIQLTNVGNAPLALDNVSVSGSFEILGNVPSSLAPGANATFEVRMPTNTLGNRNGALRINIPSGGDFDNDGDTDGRDFLTWQRELGSAASLVVWEENFGESLGQPDGLSFEAPLVGLVREPSNLPSQASSYRNGP